MKIQSKWFAGSVITISLLLVCGTGLAASSLGAQDYLALRQVRGLQEEGAARDVIRYEVVISNPSKAIQDFQFDLSYDPAELEYVDGSYEMGELIAKWPVCDDNVIEPGHVRLGALNPLDAIPQGSRGVLAVFTFRVKGAVSLSGPKVELFAPDGGVHGFIAKN
jgi:hypothetical protein